MQILAVDLGTDIFPALGLGVEPPEKGVMELPPRPRNKRLLDWKTLLRAYCFLGPIEAALAMSAFFFAFWLRGWTPGAPLPESGAVYAAAPTMTFAGFVAEQMAMSLPAGQPSIRICRWFLEPSGHQKPRVRPACRRPNLHAQVNAVFGRPLTVKDIASCRSSIIVLGAEVESSS